MSTALVWLLVGVALMIGEVMLVGTFHLLWLGMAAFGVAVLAWLGIVTEWTTQILVWVGSGLLLTIFWLRVGPGTGRKTLSRLGRASDDAIGREGVMVEVASDGMSGEVSFNAPLLGARHWQVLSIKKVTVGDRVEVIEVLGNRLRVDRPEPPIE